MSKFRKFFKEKLYMILNSKAYAIINIIILVLSAISLSNGNIEFENEMIDIIFFQLDKVYSVFFIVDSILTFIVTPIKKTITTFWGIFNILVCVISILSLCDFPNFTSIRLWLIIKYLPKLPGLKYVKTICDAIESSMPVIKDIGIFTAFFFVGIGILLVTILGGRLSYRCINYESYEIYDEEFVCSSDLQCPLNYSCLNSFLNPDKGTISFDNIFISWLNIFQILTTEGWSNIYFTVSSVISKFSIIFFLLIIIIGNWLILQLIVATVVSSLQKSIKINKTYNFKMKKAFISNINPNGKKQRLKKKLEKFINKQWVEKTILFITIIDTIAVCSVSNKMSRKNQKLIYDISISCTFVFITEMIIKIYVMGFKGYITSSFYNFTDFLFTLISVFELIARDENGAAVFRVLRSFRVLRLTKFIPQLSNLIAVFCDSAKPLLSLIIIWGLSVICFSLFAVQFFEGGMNFSNNKPKNNFENFLYSLLSVIQLYTVENWDSIKTNVVESKGIYATIIPVVIIIIGAYIFSQFLIAILLNSILDRLKSDYNFQELNNDNKRDAKHIIKYVFNELFDTKFDSDNNINDPTKKLEGPKYAANEPISETDKIEIEEESIINDNDNKKEDKRKKKNKFMLTRILNKNKDKVESSDKIESEDEDKNKNKDKDKSENKRKSKDKNKNKNKNKDKSKNKNKEKNNESKDKNNKKMKGKEKENLFENEGDITNRKKNKKKPLFNSNSPVQKYIAQTSKIKKSMDFDNDYMVKEKNLLYSKKGNKSTYQLESFRNNHIYLHEDSFKQKHTSILQSLKRNPISHNESIKSNQSILKNLKRNSTMDVDKSKHLSLLKNLKRNSTAHSGNSLPLKYKTDKDKSETSLLNSDIFLNIPLLHFGKNKNHLNESEKNINIKRKEEYANSSTDDLDKYISSNYDENLINNFDTTFDLSNKGEVTEIIFPNDNDIYLEKSDKFKMKNVFSHKLLELKEKYSFDLNESMNTSINFPQTFNKAIDRSKAKKEMLKAKESTQEYITKIKDKYTVEITNKLNSTPKIFSKVVEKGKANSELLKSKIKKYGEITNNNILLKKSRKGLREGKSSNKDVIIDYEISDYSNQKIKNEDNKSILNEDDDSEDDSNSYSSETKRSKIMNKIKKLHQSYRDSYFVHICNKILYSRIYFIIMNIIVIFSCISIFFENPRVKEDKYITYYSIRDNIIANLFYIDLVIKFFANGIYFTKNGYIKRFICWIDILTIAVSILNITVSDDYDYQLVHVLKLIYFAKFVYMQEGLRIVTIAIWKTIPSIFVAIIPYAFYLLICSLIGISLFVDKGWQCSDTSVLTMEHCTGYYVDRFENNVLRHWIPYSVTFDNIFDGLLSTFVISHQEAWPDIMYRYINLSSDDVVRPEKIHLGYSLYFINALLIGNWLFLSVITAVTFSSLKKNQDILSGIQYLTDGQRKILNYLKILVTNSPKSKSNNTSKTKTRRLVESRFFNRVMLTVICISIICMMMISYNLDPFISEILSYAELCFTLIYIIELILLFKAYGIKDFFKDFWNILSFFIVFTSVISILFERYIPAAALVLIRLVRIIRLFQYSKGIKALGMAVMFNFTQLTNVLILMFLTCCIYAVIGYSYFGDINIEHTSYLSENVNFSTFFKSLTTVFIFSTGEGWPFGMADCMGKTITNCDPEEENCGTPYAVIFFISLHVVLNWILLNSFSAITVDTFINVLEEHDEIVRLEKVWDEFNKQWIEYDTNKSGEVVFTDLINIYDEFELPKGAQWGSRERAKGLLATKPPIEELFKNIKVKNNKCSYDDTIYSFLNCWMGEELPESYVKKERVVPQTGYEKKNIEKTKEKVVPQTGYEEKNIETTKEKVYNIYDGYDSTAVASSSSTPISVNTLNPNNSNYNELMNANYSYHLNETDDEEICSSSSQNVETYYQFNNNNTERINILVDDAPRSSGRIRSPLATSSSSLYSYDDKCTNNSKYIYYEEPLESEIYLIEDNQRNYINNPIINNNVYNNIKTDNYYLSATTNSSSEDNCSNNSNSERTPLTSKFKYQLNHNKMEDKSNTYAGHEENLNGSNYSNNKKFKLPFRKTFTETFSKSKTVLFPGKEIFSESFSKGKAIHLPSIDTFSESFSKGKAILLPNKETFSETFSKGKAIILPKNKNSTSTRETSIEDQEIPFNVVYNIWKLQYRFKEKRQQIQECDKISIV